MNRHLWLVNDLSELKVFALTFSKILELPISVALFGDLGSGKTTLVRFLAQSLGVKENVKSPSYNILEIYPLNGPGKLFHLDLYRLSRGAPIDFLLSGHDLQQGLIMVEWAEHVDRSFCFDLEISIRIETGTQRQIVIRPLSSLGRKVTSAAVWSG